MLHTLPLLPRLLASQNQQNCPSCTLSSSPDSRKVGRLSEGDNRLPASVLAFFSGMPCSVLGGRLALGDLSEQNLDPYPTQSQAFTGYLMAQITEHCIAVSPISQLGQQDSPCWYPWASGSPTGWVDCTTGHRIYKAQGLHSRSREQVSGNLEEILL